MTEKEARELVRQEIKALRKKKMTLVIDCNAFISASVTDGLSREESERVF